MTSPTASAKVTARGLVPTTDKMNAIVLAFKVAISLRAGLQTKGPETDKESHTLPLMLRNRCAPIAFVQRVNLFLNPWGKKNNSPGSPSSNPYRICLHCLVSVSRYFALIVSADMFGLSGCFSIVA